MTKPALISVKASLTKMTPLLATSGISSGTHLSAETARLGSGRGVSTFQFFAFTWLGTRRFRPTKINLVLCDGSKVLNTSRFGQLDWRARLLRGSSRINRSCPFVRWRDWGNEGRSAKTEIKLRVYLCRSNPFARNEGRSAKTEVKLRFFVCWSNPFARKGICVYERFCVKMFVCKSVCVYECICVKVLCVKPCV